MPGKRLASLLLQIQLFFQIHVIHVIPSQAFVAPLMHAKAPRRWQAKRLLQRAYFGNQASGGAHFEAQSQGQSRLGDDLAEHEALLAAAPTPHGRRFELSSLDKVVSAHCVAHGCVVNTIGGMLVSFICALTHWQAELHGSSWEGYFWVYMQIGTPPQRNSVIVDTGSGYGPPLHPFALALGLLACWLAPLQTSIANATLTIHSLYTHCPHPPA